jgi:hypothetical protein
MDDGQFLLRFESAAIPSDHWTHRDHVRVAFLYLRDGLFDDALIRIRRGIQELNRANGILDSSTSGYHETVTVAWARIIASTIGTQKLVHDFDAFEIANPHLLTKGLLRKYYTRDRLFSTEARSTFVDADISPLPSWADDDRA